MPTIQKILSKLSDSKKGKATLLYSMRLWPPFLGAGIRVVRIDEQFTHVEVEMRMRPWNANYVGTHFGGSLYAMCDPFYMLMLMEILGSEYIVWDKAATIRFRKPGKGTVRASFAIDPEEVERIRQLAEGGDKVEPRFRAFVKDASGDTIAEVEKTIYVRLKSAHQARA